MKCQLKESIQKKTVRFDLHQKFWNYRVFKKILKMESYHNQNLISLLRIAYDFSVKIFSSAAICENQNLLPQSSSRSRNYKYFK